MPSPIQQALLFLLDTIFSLFFYAVLLRIIFQIMRINFYNPVAQAIVKVTNPALVPMRRLIPGFKGHDVAAFALLILVQLTYIVFALLLMPIKFNFSIGSLMGVIIWCFGDIIANIFKLYFWIIIISIVLSWVSPMNPITGVLKLITDPILKPIQKRVPPIGIFDLSPMIVIIGISLCEILISGPIIVYGKNLIRF